MRQKADLSNTVIVVFFVFAISVLLESCEKYSFEVGEVDPDETVLFQSEIQPVFTKNCITCHKGSRDPDLRDGLSYASLTEGDYVTLPAETSGLYTRINSGSHLPFTLPEEKLKILYWIEQGALNNK